ncbi:Trans-enoyl reductase lepG [Colletotrichum gloeosporioides]|uniref:Trans-enoyl reductase lepG n=1 Tax=Colletotrichum gloeosporioides TaxID=474922 RepID=A0A8H4CXN5_COLGL|nr:Trans-enoyl reductase lepG [Colletotrichum gloeosporioides]KAF3811722.1 Trans-enoyl reductase lepG [Colletotrichum gloeosporioides]
MKALVLSPSKRSVSVKDIPIPSPGPREVLIRVCAVALNHVDAVYVNNPIATQDDRVIGSDFSGEVVKVGEGLDVVDDTRVQIGARVAGFVQGACSVNLRPGAFAEYIVIGHDLTWHIPTTMSFESAATVSLCGLTAAQGVFARLQLPCPFFNTRGFSGLGLADDGPISVFIYGATSSLGLYAAQLVRASAKTSGCRIQLIGAASASKHAMLKQEPYGYDVLVDYGDADWVEKVRGAAGGGVQYAIDAISRSTSVERVEQTLAEEGQFAAFRSPALGGFDISKMRVKPLIGAVWEGLGVEVLYQGFLILGATLPANPEARRFTAEFYNHMGSGASSGVIKLQPNPVRLMSGGLERIASEGFALLTGAGEGRPVSAEKIVCTIV